MFVVGVAATATIIACGGPDNSHSDAKVYMDAKVFMDGPAAATGIGKICTGAGSGDPTMCPTMDMICARLTGGTNFFCTKSCGTGGSNMPPSGGDAACAAGETTPGTAACALRGAGSGSAFPWACGVLCGTAGSASFGSCPTGLTCTNNVCS